MTRENWQKHKNATGCHICNILDVLSLCMTMALAGIAIQTTEDTGNPKNEFH